MKAIRWKHIACALGIAVHKPHLKSEIWYNTFWIHKKSTLHWSEKLAMSHYAQTPNALAFSVAAKQSSFLSSVYLQLMIEFQPPKIPFLLCVCVPNTHSCYQYTRQHAQQSLSSAFRWGPMETVLIISLLLQSTAVCFGIRGFLWRLHMHTHWLQARNRERERERALLLNKPPH